jgi:hypothetical protein
VFILGAGASQEAGLPVGEKLRDIVSEYFDFRVNRGMLDPTYGDSTIFEALRGIAAEGKGGWGGDVNPYLHAGRRLRDALPQSLSVDNLLDAHRGDDLFKLCGKLGIARCILDAEKTSALRVREPFERAKMLRGMTSKWYGRLWHLLSEGVPAGKAGDLFQNISFVSFNYDRCIEHFLEHAIANYYCLEEPDVAAMMSKLVIYHPYGSVGPLRWQAQARPDQVVAFGQEHAQIAAVSAKLKTFTERVEDPAFLDQLSRAVTDADVVVFLGFAFHPQNMELLRRTAKTPNTRVYATVLGISESDQDVVRDLIMTTLQLSSMASIRLLPKTCSELFDEFRLSLPFGR